MKELHVAKGVSWPGRLASQAVGVLGTRGAGKSNLGRVYAEELFAAKVPFIVFDPIGNWYGIRAGSNGKASGGIPIPIFGGEHGDLQLDRTSGRKIADLVLDKRLSCVLDLSHADFSETDKRRFLVDFGDRLFRKKSRESGWLTLIMEEADDYAPQTAKGPLLPECLGLFQRLVKRGRFKGLGAFMITQRSAAINKDLLYMVGTLVAFRATGPRDQKAVQGWVKYNALAEDLVASLPGLEHGEAWVISPDPDALGFAPTRVKFRRMRTYDTGATPEHGTGAVPATLADIDVPALSKELEAAVEKARAEDPRELLRTIADLRAELKKTSRREKIVEVPAFRGVDIKRVERAIERFRDGVATFMRVGDVLTQRMQVVTTEAGNLSGLISGYPATDQVRAVAGVADVEAGKVPKHVQAATAMDLTTRVVPSGNGFDGVQQRILSTICMLDIRGIKANRTSVARWMGIHPNGGRYLTSLARLRESGHLSGFAVISALPYMGDTGVNGAIAAVEGTRRKMLEVISQQQGGFATRMELAETLGLHPNGGRFLTDLARLRDMGLIPERGRIELTEGALR